MAISCIATGIVGIPICLLARCMEKNEEVCDFLQEKNCTAMSIYNGTSLFNKKRDLACTINDTGVTAMVVLLARCYIRLSEPGKPSTEDAIPLTKVTPV